MATRLEGISLMQQGSEAINLEHALRILKRRAPLVALCLIVVAGAALAYSKHQPKKYEATASLAFSNNQLSQQVAGLPAVNSDVPAQQASELELVKLGNMAATTARQLGHGLTAEKVQGSLSIAEQGESGVVTVSATSTSPTLAAAIANAYTKQFVSEQQVVNQRYFQSALTVVNRQIARLSKEQRSSAVGVELLSRAQTLRLLTELNYGNVQVAQEAFPPVGPSSPKTKRNTALGAFLGLVIGLGLALLLERTDRRVKEPDELQAIFQLPLLGTVPESAPIGKAASSEEAPASVPALPRAEAEAFSLVRAHLRYFNVDRDIRRILVASPAPEDGKTTVAIHLAAAAARAGSRVLLLEADLRRPTISSRLALKPRLGLADLLIGAASFDDAKHIVDVGSLSGEGAGRRSLDVLPAGSTIPPNPAELLESRAMTSLLEKVGAMYDFVVVDTPPLSVVSDAFPLLSRVDGVVVVGWVGRSRRDDGERLSAVLKRSGAPLLGVIANGSRLDGEGVYMPLRDDVAPQAPTAAALTASADDLMSAGRA